MWSIDSSMHWWLYRGWFPGTCTDHKLKSFVVTGHWLSTELSSKHHEGRSASILCVWCGTWGAEGAVTSPLCSASPASQGLWGSQWKNTRRCDPPLSCHSEGQGVHMLMPYWATCLPSCFFQHIISPHIFWACITSLLIFTHMHRPLPRAPLSPLQQECLSTRAPTNPPSSFGSGHGVLISA